MADTKLHYISLDNFKSFISTLTTSFCAPFALKDHKGNRIADTYAPKTGTGASGTWAINISGNAAKSTNAVNAQTASNATKLNNMPAGGAKGEWSVIPFVGNDGVMEIGKYIDFHSTKNDNKDYSSRFTAEANGTVSVGAINGTLNGKASTAGTADIAKKLQTAYAISLSGDMSGTAKFDGSGNVSINTTKLEKNAKIVDLTASTYNQNTWYPVVGNQLPYTGYSLIKVANQLDNQSHPAWAKHGSGFTANLTLLTSSPGWGTAADESIVLQYSFNWVSDNKNPVSFGKMSNSSVPVLYLRGGGKYKVYADYNTPWSIKTATYTSNNQSVSPQSSCPAISISRAKIYANLNGTADNATKLQTARTINGVSFDGSANITIADSTKLPLTGGNIKGNLTVSGDITGARVFNAVYNDYAEFFEKGEEVEPGDIIALDDSNKEKEQYVRATSKSKVVVGICTNEYGHILGGNQQSEEENKKEFIPVSLMGRVHVKVYGHIEPGDKITVSDIPGLGVKAENDTPTKILGTALTYNESGKGMVRILVNN